MKLITLQKEQAEDETERQLSAVTQILTACGLGFVASLRGNKIVIWGRGTTQSEEGGRMYEGGRQPIAEIPLVSSPAQAWEEARDLVLFLKKQTLQKQAQSADWTPPPRLEKD